MVLTFCIDKKTNTSMSNTTKCILQKVVNNVVEKMQYFWVTNCMSRFIPNGQSNKQEQKGCSAVHDKIYHYNIWHLVRGSFTVLNITDYLTYVA